MILIHKEHFWLCEVYSFQKENEFWQMSTQFSILPFTKEQLDEFDFVGWL